MCSAGTSISLACSAKTGTLQATSLQVLFCSDVALLRLLFLFQLGPARVKLICDFLRFVHFAVGTQKLGAIARNRGVFELGALLLKHLLGFGYAALDSRVLARFQIRQLFLRGGRFSGDRGAPCWAAA